MRPIVRRLLLDLWSDQPRDNTAQRRRELEQRLVQMGSSAADEGGQEVLVCLQVIEGVPLAASGVVSVLGSVAAVAIRSCRLDSSASESNGL